MKYLIILTGIILLISLIVKYTLIKMDFMANRNNTNTKNRKGTIKFIKNQEINNILIKINFKKYISQFNKNEVPYKIKNYKKYKSLLDGYISNISDFTASEKKFIKKCVINLNKFELVKKLDMIDWNIVKTNTNIEWGFSFTYDKYIFISEKTINMYNNNLQEMMKLLLHEQIHILQRKIQSTLDTNLYNKWNFIKPVISLDKALEDSIITNPDGIDKYIFVSKNKRYYLPTLMLSSNGNVDEVAIEMITDDEKNFRNTYNMIDIDKIPHYILSLGFDINQDLYHPNEILAHHLSEMILNLVPKDHKITEIVNKIIKKN